MTKTEAAEIILKGPIWVTCPLCVGNRVADDSMASTITCTWCLGKGTSVREDYKRACEVLDMLVPTKMFTWRPGERVGGR